MIVITSGNKTEVIVQLSKILNSLSKEQTKIYIPDEVLELFQMKSYNHKGTEIPMEPLSAYEKLVENDFNYDRNAR